MPEHDMPPEDAPREAPHVAIPSRGGAIALAPSEHEVARVLQICNACRYCEGFCAVFPAMTRRLEFGRADVHYLANLCHNCGACYHACQYAPPHEFDLNVPVAMAKVRARTYAEYAWPPKFGRLYERNGLTVACAMAGGLALFVALTMPLSDGRAAVRGAADFYAVLSHGLLAGLFSVVLGFAVLSLAAGVRRFWRDTAPAPEPRAGGRVAAIADAASDVLSLANLDGGHGKGCNESDDAFTLWRRRFHHCTFYGFLLCLAATAVATLEHYLLGIHAPYAYDSLPVILGSAGGFGLLIGPAGLLWLNLNRHPATCDADQKPMDRAFIGLLLANSVTGFALLFGRGTGAMPLLLAVHLGFVLALFTTLPYGKFAHGVYRCAALLECAIERRQPDRLRLGSE
jgi:citrate/tricarballylate utilization protein